MLAHLSLYNKEEVRMWLVDRLVEKFPEVMLTRSIKDNNKNNKNKDNINNGNKNNMKNKLSYNKSILIHYTIQCIAYNRIGTVFP